MATIIPETPAKPAKSSDRSYPITADLRYSFTSRGRVLATGMGQTKAMSGKRLWFESKEPLLIGVLIEITVDWPVRLDNKVPLKLCVLGRTIRSEAKHTAVEILRHEFRTGRILRSLPSQSLVAAPPRRTMSVTAF